MQSVPPHEDLVHPSSRHQTPPLQGGRAVAPAALVIHPPTNPRPASSSEGTQGGGRAARAPREEGGQRGHPGAPQSARRAARACSAGTLLHSCQPAPLFPGSPRTPPSYLPGSPRTPPSYLPGSPRTCWPATPPLQGGRAVAPAAPFFIPPPTPPQGGWGNASFHIIFFVMRAHFDLFNENVIL